jgi:Ca2+-binding RTX toxin-like protein
LLCRSTCEKVATTKGIHEEDEMRRMGGARFALPLLFAAALTFGAFPTPAHAGTAEIVGFTLQYTDTAGTEWNDVRVSFSSGTYTITDRGAVISLGSSDCAFTADPQVVTCTGFVNQIDLNGRGGSDFLAVEGVGTPAVIGGGPGDDTLVGGSADDRLFGAAGADTLRGGPGADRLDGGTTQAGSPEFGDTADYSDHTVPVTVDLDGVADDGAVGEGDLVTTDVENITGGSGDDVLTGDSKFFLGGQNTLRGEEGDDTLNGAGGEGSSSLGDRLFGGAGRDALNAGDARDQLFGDTGNDILAAGGHDDHLSGGDGDDLLTGGRGADDTNGGPGVDTVDYSDHSNAVQVDLDGSPDDGSAEDDHCLVAFDCTRDWVHDDVENMIGGPGSDTLTGDGDPNSLDGGDGPDNLLGEGGNDRLVGGSAGPNDGGDALIGGPGSDTAVYLSRADPVTVSLDGNGNDGRPGEGDNALVENILGGFGDDTLIGSGSANELNGAFGFDTADYSSRTDALRISLDGVANDGGLTGAEGDNVRTENVVGGSAGDVLQGDIGQNKLSGGPGNDSLDGGAGADELIGNLGSDTADYSSRSNNVEVSLDERANDGEWTGSESVEDDNVRSDVENLVGGGGDDGFIGSAGDNVIRGGAGADVMWGEAGNDQLFGDAGRDYFRGGPGADVFRDSSGNDTADYHFAETAVTVSLDDVANDGAPGEGDDVGSAIENVDGGLGNDTLIGNGNANRLTGWYGDDTLQGGLGTDTLQGDLGGGSDVGNDTVTYGERATQVRVDLDGVADDGEPGENDDITGVENIVGGSGSDTLIGNEGENRLSGGPGDDSLDGGLGSDVLRGQTGAGDSADYSSRMDPVTVTLDCKFGDGEEAENDNVCNDVENVFGGSGGDTLTGSGSSNALFGLGGPDTVSGLGAGDRLVGGAENDTLDGGGENDVLLGADGNDALNGGPGSDSLIGDIGDDLLSGGDGADNLQGGNGADQLAGEGEDDTLDGQAGPDTVEGGTGVDAVTYASRAAAVVLIEDGLANDGESGEGDNIAADVETLQGTPYADTLRGGGGPNTLDGGAGNDALDGGGGPDTFRGGDGTDTATYASRSVGVEVTIGAVADDGEPGEGDDVAADMENVTGGAGADALTGGVAANVLRGGAGKDRLFGLDGNDVLVGGGGPDAFAGGAGLDTADYAARTADLSLTLDGLSNDGEFREGDKLQDVELIVGGAGNDTFVGDVNANTFDGGGGADTFSGGDGADTVSYSARTTPVGVIVDDMANDGAAGEGDNVASDVENVTGGKGADQLVGSAADNVLTGGAGPDTLDGGPGSDTLTGGLGTDKADYATRTGAVQIELDALANDGESGEADLVQSDIEILVGGAGDDTFVGNARPNTFDGGPGADTYTGGDDVDTVTYASRANSVSVTLDRVADDGERGERDNLDIDIERVLGGSAADRLVGNGFKNLLFGNGGGDLIDGGSDEDVLSGGPGNDALEALDGESDEVLCGAGLDGGRADPATVDRIAADCERIESG